MKSNNDYTGFSVLRDEYYQTWADYHVKYLELMAKNGLPFWGISTGNEPLNGLVLTRLAPFMSLGWGPMLQGKWIADNLGPTMKRSTVTKDIKILTGDDQRYTVPTWLMLMEKVGKNVTDFIDGIAVHWYADRIASTDFLDMTAKMYPNKFLISTEACSGFTRQESNKIDFGAWHKLEDLVLDVIEDFEHFVTGWIDWNLVLNEYGGPSYANNFVDAAIITAGSEIYKQPTFYGMGHFSRFIPEGSVRIRTKSSNKFIKTVGFLRSDGYSVLVMYNL
jgi:glucosylceramidase